MTAPVEIEDTRARTVGDLRKLLADYPDETPLAPAQYLGPGFAGITVVEQWAWSDEAHAFNKLTAVGVLEDFEGDDDDSDKEPA